MAERVTAAILGSGNIGTDLMIKLLRSKIIELKMVAGVDPKSEGLAMARERGLKTTTDSIDGLLADPDSGLIVFDATSAWAHRIHAPRLREAGRIALDLTPAAVGPFIVPGVNVVDLLDEPNVNLVSCGGQATIPIVSAINKIAPVEYAEIVATIASLSAGPGTRQNIDEFTRETARGLEEVGGAKRGKAIIILNPAEPPMIMRDTIFTLSSGADEAEIERSVEAMIEKVRAYVPGYRLKQKVQFERFGSNNPVSIPGLGDFEGIKTSVFLEVEGAAHYLPAYAGNLDIMTSAALATAEKIAMRKLQGQAA